MLLKFVDMDKVLKAIQKSIFTWNHIFLHQILQFYAKVNIEDSKIHEISKSTLGHILRYFDFLTP